MDEQWGLRAPRAGRLFHWPPHQPAGRGMGGEPCERRKQDGEQVVGRKRTHTQGLRGTECGSRAARMWSETRGGPRVRHLLVPCVLGQRTSPPGGRPRGARLGCMHSGVQVTRGAASAPGRDRGGPRSPWRDRPLTPQPIHTLHTHFRCFHHSLGRVARWGRSPSGQVSQF